MKILKNSQLLGDALDDYGTVVLRKFSDPSPVDLKTVYDRENCLVSFWKTFDGKIWQRTNAIPSHFFAKEFLSVCESSLFPEADLEFIKWYWELWDLETPAHRVGTYHSWFSASETRIYLATRRIKTTVIKFAKIER